MCKKKCFYLQREFVYSKTEIKDSHRLSDTATVSIRSAWLGFSRQPARTPATVERLQTYVCPLIPASACRRWYTLPPCLLPSFGAFKNTSKQRYDTAASKRCLSLLFDGVAITVHLSGFFGNILNHFLDAIFVYIILFFGVCIIAEVWFFHSKLIKSASNKKKRYGVDKELFFF